MHNNDISAWLPEIQGFNRLAPIHPPATDRIRINAAELLEQMLNLFDSAAVVIDRRCRLIQSNHLAHDGFDNLLQLGQPDEPVLPVLDEHKDDWLTCVNAASIGTAQAITLSSKLPPAPVYLRPLDIGLPLEFGQAVLVCSTRAQCVNDTNLQAYSQAAGLSRTEAKTLALIAKGHAPADIARLRNVSEFTVRAQIKSLYRRTQTRSVRELLISVGKLPALRSRYCGIDSQL